MKNPIGSLSALIALSAAAASAGIVASPFANEEVCLTNGSSLDIDMNGDTTNDFTIYGNAGGSIVGETGNEIFVLDEIDFNAKPFVLGEEINLSEIGAESANLTNLVGEGFSYVGVKFLVGGQTNLGWIQLFLPNSSSGVLVRGAWNDTPDTTIPAGGGSAVMTPTIGPLTGGNMALITNAAPNIGNGSDITNIVVGTVGTTNILDQGTNWVRIVMPAGSSEGLKDIVIQSGSVGNTMLANAYTYTTACILPAPSGVSATYGTYTNRVRVTWLGVTGATSYELYRSQTNNPSEATLIADIPESFALRLQPVPPPVAGYYYDDYTVVGRQSYYYWVRAFGGSGVSALSCVAMGYAELGSGQTVGRSDLTVSDMVFLPVTLTNGSPAGTVSYRLANGGPDTLTTAPVRFDFYMVQSNQAAWMAYNETNVTLAAGAEELVILTPQARNEIRARSDLAGQYTVQARVRHLDLIGDGHTGSNTTDAAGTVRVKASGVNSPGRSINDYDGDGRADVAVFKVGQGIWSVAFSGMRYTQFLEQATLLSNWQGVPGDYDGDGLTDVGLYNPASGYWWVSLSSNHQIVGAKCGEAGFVPAPADFDGDGKTDPLVYRDTDGYWLGMGSVSGYAFYGAWWCGVAPQPVTADYDGDRCADLMVYEESTGQWFGGLSSAGYQLVSGGYGGPGFMAVPADYDGDGRVDFALYEHATGWWYVLMSNRSTGPIGQGYREARCQLGSPYGLPVVADYDGDGLADPAVYHIATGLWQIYLSSQGYALLSGGYGGPEYAPVTE